MSKDRDVLNEFFSIFKEGQRSIPADLAVAFCERYLKGYLGEVDSWDTVFGKPDRRKRREERIRTESEEGAAIAAEVDRLKSEGTSLDFEEIGKALKLTAASAPTVKRRLKKP